MTAYLITMLVLQLIGAGASAKAQNWFQALVGMGMAGWAIYLLVTK